MSDILHPSPRRRIPQCLIASIALISPAMATAQDVVVMRRLIATPEINPAATWRTGDWTWTTNDGCTPTAPRIRTVTCQLGGKDVADAKCSKGSRPASSGTAERTDACTFSWNVGAWGPWNSQCSVSATRSRMVSCTSATGKSADSETRCTDVKPVSTESSLNQTSCKFQWKPFPPNWGNIRDYENPRASLCTGGRITIHQPNACFNGASGPYQAQECIKGGGPGEIPGAAVVSSDYRAVATDYACSVQTSASGVSTYSLGGGTTYRNQPAATGTIDVATSMSFGEKTSLALAACLAATKADSDLGVICALDVGWRSSTGKDRIIWALTHSYSRYYISPDNKSYCNNGDFPSPGAGWSPVNQCPSTFVGLRVKYTISAPKASYACTNGMKYGYTSFSTAPNGDGPRELTCTQ